MSKEDDDASATIADTDTEGIPLATGDFDFIDGSEEVTPTHSPWSNIQRAGEAQRSVCEAFERLSPLLDISKPVDRLFVLKQLRALATAGELGFRKYREAVSAELELEEAMTATPKKLANLDPRWISNAGRVGAGISFSCPGNCCADAPLKYRVHVLFRNPMDGGDPSHGEPRWNRTGITFDTLSLTPSVDCSGQGHFHGFVTNGEIR